MTLNILHAKTRHKTDKSLALITTFSLLHLIIHYTAKSAWVHQTKLKLQPMVLKVHTTKYSSRQIHKREAQLNTPIHCLKCTYINFKVPFWVILVTLIYSKSNMYDYTWQTLEWLAWLESLNWWTKNCVKYDIYQREATPKVFMYE